MPTIVSGELGIKAASAVATAKRDVGLGVALLNPSVGPLVLLSQIGNDPRNVADTGKAKLQKRVSGDMKIEWVEDVLQPSTDSINLSAGYTSSDTGLAVTSGYAQTYQYLYVNRTGEIMYVSAGGGTTSITVTRGALGTTAAALLNGDDLTVLDATNYDGAVPPTALNTAKSLQYNYLEPIRTTVDMTRIMQNTKYFGEEKDWEYQKKKKAIEHVVKMERKFMFSARSYADTGNGSTQRLWTTGGLTQMITTNVINCGGTLTEKSFDINVSEPVYKDGIGSSNERILLASDRLITVMTQWGKDKMKFNVGDMKLGMMVHSYASPHGTFYVIPHRLIRGTQGVAGIVIDPGNIKYRYLQNMDTEFLDDVIKDGRQAKVSEWSTVAGLEIRNQETMALIYNVQN